MQHALKPKPVYLIGQRVIINNAEIGTVVTPPRDYIRMSGYIWVHSPSRAGVMWWLPHYLNKQHEDGMMDDNKRVTIAREFVELHKNPEIDYWILNSIPRRDKFLEVYANLENGLYGDVSEEFPSEFQIEIPRDDCCHGVATIYTWEE